MASKTLFSSHRPDIVAARQAFIKKKKPPSLLPLWLFLFFTLVYIAAIVMSATPIVRLSPNSLTLWMSHLIVDRSAWWSEQWALATDPVVAQQLTGLVQFLLMMVLAFVAYCFCALCARSHIAQEGSSFFLGLLWLVVGVCCVIYLFVPGYFSSAFLVDAVYGRVLGVYGSNPYFITPAELSSSDSLIHSIQQQDSAIHGPVWMIISSLLALFAGGDLSWNVLTFRGFMIIAHGCNIALIISSLRALGRSPRTVVLGAVLYGLNPLVLFEAVNGAHNDIFMLTLVLAGLRASITALQGGILQWRATILAIEFFVLAALVNVAMLPLSLFFMLAFFRKVLLAPGRRSFLQAIASLSIMIVFSGLVILFWYSSFWLGRDWSDITTMLRMLPFADRTLNSTIITFQALSDSGYLPASLSLLTTEGFWRIFNLATLGLACLVSLILLWYKPTIQSLILATLWIFAAFLIGTTWFFPWYVTWLLPLVALLLPISNRRLARALFTFSLLFSLCAFGMYYIPLVGKYIQEEGLTAPAFPWQLVLGIIILILPLGCALLSSIIWPRTRSKSVQSTSTQSTQRSILHPSWQQ